MSRRPGDPCRLGRVLETGVYAEDLDAAERFYAEVLGLEVLLREEGRHVFFRFPGDGRPGEAGVFLVFNPQASAEASEGPEGGGVIPGHGAHGPSHMAFAIEDGKVEAWRSHLVKHGVAIESEVVKPDGRGRSLYFRDPAGNSIELATPGIWDVDET